MCGKWLKQTGDRAEATTSDTKLGSAGGDEGDEGALHLATSSAQGTDATSTTSARLSPLPAPSAALRAHYAAFRRRHSAFANGRAWIGSRIPGN
ncbi:unnamed protein product [Angiostrongylus costaricensis]|uniref:Uncharacterized protein n=1 Tax=Angiostrongylus costaricensis TaxID=334426 RepID=A0A0R3PI74_ANGCS|nr:unnamed protein product [Angiostrongylus costaricensis]